MAKIVINLPDRCVEVKGDLSLAFRRSENDLTVVPLPLSLRLLPSSEATVAVKLVRDL